jgi:proteasome lid subunit RPN8/RPN11
MSGLDEMPIVQALNPRIDRAKIAARVSPPLRDRVIDRTREKLTDLNDLPERTLGALSARRSSGLDIIVRRSALSCIRAHGDANPDLDTYGILVGNLYRDAKGPYLLVEQIIQTETAGSADFSGDTWQNIQAIMEQEYPQSRIVGWYRTNPGHDVYLTQEDRALHENLFGVPWQAALIYNPRLRETGVFSTRAGAMLGMEFLVESDQKASKSSVSTTRRVASRVAQFMLAMVALGLFAAMGYLLALLVLQIQPHIHLPPQHIPY